MTGQRRDQIEQLYEQARVLPREARAGFISDACGDDPELRSDLLSLLEIAEPAEELFERLAEVVSIPSAPGEPTPGQRVSHYQIIDFIGAGGMGSVYRARDTRLNRDVALKFLPPYLRGSPGAEERFLVEARSAAALEHPNVCTVHEIGETAQGQPFIAMALYQGETLKERLLRGPLPPAEALAVTLQVARGLGAAHARGIVHRDVKPGNIMLTPDGRVKLLDFGLAKVADVSLTASGMTPGTVTYMSPEQARGDPLDARTDLWSLGVVLYEMLTGVQPFRGGNNWAVVRAILYDEAEPVSRIQPETPAALTRVLDRLLRKAPAERLGRAEDLVTELVGISASLASPPQTIDGPSHRRRLSAARAAIGGGALLSLIGLVWLTRRSDSRMTESRPSIVAEAAPGIAVLPFNVQDRTLASWREGLVDLISLDLSDVTGLRAIDTRTVLARWREHVAGSEMPDLTTALDVAHRTGAQYALVGSVIPSQSDLLLTARVHEVESRRMLGTSRIQGPADSILTLVDRLTMETLRLILRGKTEELPRINLARASTPSLPALKSFLEGEVLFRRSEFQGAAAAYSRAVESDSDFALARYRLGLTLQWSWLPIASGRPNPLLTELGQFRDRLPPHEAALARAALAKPPEGRELLEEEVRRYPEDAETWYQLGELYLHGGAEALVPVDSADHAFSRAIELDSSFSLPYIHLIERAISVGDSAATARLLGTYTRFAPGSPFVPWYQMMSGLAFGDSVTRTAAGRQMDTLSTVQLFRLGISFQGQRCCWDLSEEILRVGRRRRDVGNALMPSLFWTSLRRGRARDAYGWLNDPLMPEDFKAVGLYILHDRGFAVPLRQLESGLALGRVDGSDPFHLFYTGAYAADRNRQDSHRISLRRLQAMATRLRGTGDSTGADLTEAVRQGLEGYGWWRRGQKDTALVLLERSRRSTAGSESSHGVDLNIRLRWCLSQVLTEIGKPREALPYLKTLGGTVFPADYERARIHERFGEVDQARDAYAAFLAVWQDADPEFQPMVREARAAIQRLTPATPE